MANWAESFKAMYQMLWELIYEILEMFGIKKDEEGNLVEVPTTEAK